MNIEVLNKALNWDKEHTPEISDIISKMGGTILNTRYVINPNNTILRIEYLLLDGSVLIVKVLKRKYVATLKTV